MIGSAFASLAEGVANTQCQKNRGDAEQGTSLVSLDQVQAQLVRVKIK
jgi:hypothetical protein